MILVTLGTQDKEFRRLLKAIDHEIEKGNIKDKVIVQAGYTNYQSKYMEIFDMIAKDELETLTQQADLIITHGGVGSILTALSYGKKVIAAPRLSKYREHTNDHQKQIINEFAKEGYILAVKDFSKFSKVLEKAKTFKPKKYQSNKENFVCLIDQYIEKTNHISWYNRDKKVIALALINLLLFAICYSLSINIYLAASVSYGISMVVAYLFRIEKLNSPFVLMTYTYMLDIIFLLLLVGQLNIHSILAKGLSNIVIICIYHFINKRN